MHRRMEGAGSSERVLFTDSCMIREFFVVEMQAFVGLQS